MGFAVTSALRGMYSPLIFIKAKFLVHHGSVLYSTLYLLLLVGNSIPLGLQLRETGRAERDLRNTLRVDGKEVHG
jgi:hypothetical protein